MKTTTNNFLIGLFVIAGMVVLVSGVMVLGASAIFRTTVPVEIYIAESVQGLEVGSPLRFRGVKIGQVRDITLVREVYETDFDYVLVRISVWPSAFRAADAAQLIKELQDRVDRGLRIRLAAQGLTGAAYLEAEYTDNPEPGLTIDWQPLALRIPSATSTTVRFAQDFEHILGEFADSDIIGLITAAKNSLISFQAAVEDTDVAGISSKAQDVLVTARSLIDTSRVDVHKILASTEKAIQRVDRVLGETEEFIDPEDMSKLIGEVAAFATKGAQSMQELQHLLKESSITAKNAGRMLNTHDRNLTAVLDNMRQVSEHLAELTSNLERYPSLMLFGKQPGPVKRK